MPTQQDVGYERRFGVLFGIPPWRKSKLSRSAKDALLKKIGMCLGLNAPCFPDNQEIPSSGERSIAILGFKNANLDGIGFPDAPEPGVCLSDSILDFVAKTFSILAFAAISKQLKFKLFVLSQLT